MAVDLAAAGLAEVAILLRLAAAVVHREVALAAGDAHFVVGGEFRVGRGVRTPTDRAVTDRGPCGQPGHLELDLATVTRPLEHVLAHDCFPLQSGPGLPEHQELRIPRVLAARGGILKGPAGTGRLELSPDTGSRGNTSYGAAAGVAATLAPAGSASTPAFAGSRQGVAGVRAQAPATPHPAKVPVLWGRSPPPKPPPHAPEPTGRTGLGPRARARCATKPRPSG